MKFTPWYCSLTINTFSSISVDQNKTLTMHQAEVCPRQSYHEGKRSWDASVCLKTHRGWLSMAMQRSENLICLDQVSKSTVYWSCSLKNGWNISEVWTFKLLNLLQTEAIPASSGYLLMAGHWSKGKWLPLVVVTGHFVDGSRHFWNTDRQAVSISQVRVHTEQNSVECALIKSILLTALHFIKVRLHLLIF